MIDEDPFDVAVTVKHVRSTFINGSNKKPGPSPSPMHNDKKSQIQRMLQHGFTMDVALDLLEPKNPQIPFNSSAENLGLSHKKNNNNNPNDNNWQVKPMQWKDKSLFNGGAFELIDHILAFEGSFEIFIQGKNLLSHELDTLKLQSMAD